jgi:polysaccharide export outer membrane protein
MIAKPLSRSWRSPKLSAFVLVLLALRATDGVAAAPERLGAGDTIRVTVYQNPDLNTDGRISDRGTIMFPLVGEISVGGQTPLEAGASIAKRLKSGRFLVDPQVSVSVVEGRSRHVSILGHVAKPGQYALDGVSTRVTDLLAQAGGISEGGDDTIVLLRASNGKGTQERREIDVQAMYRSGDLSSDVDLQPGDTLFIPSAPVFYVYGAVQRPGEYRLHGPMTVMNALSVGGGLTPHGTDRRLKIHRRSEAGELQVLDASLTDRIQPGDVVEVRESVF